MIVRTKFTVSQITEYNNGNHGKTIVLSPVYDPGVAEDQRFSEATPSGQITMYVTNPMAIEQFRNGKSFYVDFTPI